MRLALKRHADTPCDAVLRIDVDIVGLEGRRLVLRYIATGEIARIKLPPIATSGRADELWRHTCFEAFVRPEPGPAYWEYNVAPSLQWAAYSFGEYRAGMRIAADIAVICREVNADGSKLDVLAALDLSGNQPVRLGLSAVIEETSGRKSYWALEHPPGRPDFHHNDCFAAQFPAASGA